MRIERTHHRKCSPHVHKAHKSGAAGEESATGPNDCDVFRYSDEDLDPKGKLHIIVFSQKHCNLAEIRHQIRESRHGGGLDKALPLVYGFSAHLDPRELRKVLRLLPHDANVHLNHLIDYPEPADFTRIVKGSKTAPKVPDNGPTPTASGLDPSRAVLGIEQVWQKGYTGKGIGVAVIDSGLYPHPDFSNRIKGWVDIEKGKPQPYDNFAHGTHVAGVVGGSGTKSSGRFKGIAPDADLIGVRITTVAEAIKGLQWAMDNKDKYNIRVVNMSLGDFAAKSYKDDPWAQACEKAIDAGLIVVVAAGNEGPSAGTISTPGIDPRVITVGALDDRHTVDRGDDTIASFESVGPTSIDCLPKPDIIAPGVSIYSTLAPGTTLDVPELPHVGTDYIAISGTSMATPMVVGLIADLLQANPSLTHDDVKKILEATADRYLKDGPNAQGYGLINSPRALEMALAMKTGAAAPQVPPLPSDPPQSRQASTEKPPKEAEVRAPTLNELRGLSSPRPTVVGVDARPWRHDVADGYLLHVGPTRQA